MFLLAIASLAPAQTNPAAAAASLAEHIRKQGFFFTGAEPSVEVGMAHPKVLKLTTKDVYNAVRTSRSAQPGPHNPVRTTRSAQPLICPFQRN